MDDELSTSATPIATPLHRLWALTLAACIDYLEQTPKGSIKADWLNVCRGFLRDNGIDAEVTSRLDVQQSLKKLQSLNLPFNS